MKVILITQFIDQMHVMMNTTIKKKLVVWQKPHGGDLTAHESEWVGGAVVLGQQKCDEVAAVYILWEDGRKRYFNTANSSLAGHHSLR